jgi:hypothetical protein
MLFFKLLSFKFTSWKANKFILSEPKEKDPW